MAQENNKTENRKCYVYFLRDIQGIALWYFQFKHDAKMTLLPETKLKKSFLFAARDKHKVFFFTGHHLDHGVHERMV